MQSKIRKALPADIDKIIKLCAAHASYENVHYSDYGKASKLHRMLFCENPSLHCILAEYKSEIIGYATFSKECSTWDADHYLYMDCLFLQEDFRGKGIGVYLINTIIEYAKQTGVQRLEWQTPDWNKSAIKFYQRLGGQSKEKWRFTLTI